MTTKRWVSLAAIAAMTVLPAGAPAQVRTGTVPAGGISVSGSGYVRRPADSVRYTIVLAMRGNATSASVFASAEALVAALKAHGSPDAAVSDPLGGSLNQQQVATVRGSIRKPTLESVRSLMAQVAAGLPPDGVPIQQISYVSALDDCSEPERLAQAAAFEEARARAAGIAAAAHVALGGVTAANEGFFPPNGSCPTRPDAGGVPAGFNGASSSGDAFNVTVNVTLNVTFAIAPQ